MLLKPLALLTAIAVSLPVRAETAAVAVAANFLAPLEALAASFKAETGHDLAISSGASGQLLAQVLNGAPFDVFLSADAERPAAAIEQGAAVPGSAFTYAIGTLVLWSADPALVSGAETLAVAGFDKLAIADPETAPYGRAAIETLEALDRDEALAEKLVIGESIGQTLQFIASENAELGFVALSQVIGHGDGSRWIVPEALHEPIRQDAVLLRHGEAKPAALAFMAFLRGPAAREVIEGFGYAAAGAP